MSDSAAGGCLCGAIRYRIDGAPLASVTCQCRSCRRASAAPVVPWLHLDAAQLAFTAGTPVEFESSPSVKRTFCGRCGTPLTYWKTSYGQAIDVTTVTAELKHGLLKITASRSEPPSRVIPISAAA